jgi:peptidylprolyl isomerase
MIPSMLTNTRLSFGPHSGWKTRLVARERRILSMSVVVEGSAVRLTYVGKLTTGEVFDSSEGADPLEFTVGAGEVIQGLESGIMGMAEGESRIITIIPEDAYGERIMELVSKVPRSALPAEAQVGDQLIASSGNDQFPVLVIELGETEGTLVGNHPLAGQTLVFEVTLVGFGEDEKPAPSRLILP